MISKGLIEVKYTANGIEYIASENTSPFLDNLEEEYTQKLLNNAIWVENKFKTYTYDNLKKYVLENKDQWGSDIPYCTLGLANE